MIMITTAYWMLNVITRFIKSNARAVRLILFEKIWIMLLSVINKSNMNNSHIFLRKTVLFSVYNEMQLHMTDIGLYWAHRSVHKHCYSLIYLSQSNLPHHKNNKKEKKIIKVCYSTTLVHGCILSTPMAERNLIIVTYKLIDRSLCVFRCYNSLFNTFKQY